MKLIMRNHIKMEKQTIKEKEKIEINFKINVK